jgi:hypothetical protein
MASLIDQVRNESDDRLQGLRREARQALNGDAGPDRQDEAEALLLAVEQELERRRLTAVIARFEDTYPGGFHGDAYLDRQRNHKVRASMICRDRLAAAAMRDLIGRRDWERLFDRTKLVIEMTVLLPVGYRRTRLLDEVRKPMVARLFYPALLDALHGNGEAVERLGRFAAVLDDLGLRDWAYPTYFMFLSEPDACMFVIRERMDRGLDIAGYPADLTPRPGAESYAAVLAFSGWLMDRLAALEPRDMIDLQSFIWFMTDVSMPARA